MKTTSLLAVSLFVCLGLQAVSYAYTLAPGYQAEIWASYNLGSGESTGETRDMVFDSEGNLYLPNAVTGSITKITKDKQVVKSWVTGLNNPWGIEYTGGTSYGNNLYVGCVSGNKVVKVDMNGNKSDFCSLSGATTLEYDRTGQYGNKLYVGTSASDRIYSVSTTGSATAFCNNFYNLSGSIQGIGFANSTAYGNAMYAGTWYPGNTSKSGIFKILSDGTAQRIATNLVDGWTVNYDSTGLFGGDLFVSAQDDWLQEWDWIIYRVSSNGTATFFLTSGHPFVSFTFGPDGAMYTLYMTESAPNVYDAAYIYRITPIPEPATMILFGLGLLGMRKRKR